MAFPVNELFQHDCDAFNLDHLSQAVACHLQETGIRLRHFHTGAQAMQQDKFFVDLTQFQANLIHLSLNLGHSLETVDEHAQHLRQVQALRSALA